MSAPTLTDEAVAIDEPDAERMRERDWDEACCGRGFVEGPRDDDGAAAAVPPRADGPTERACALAPLTVLALGLLSSWPRAPADWAAARPAAIAARGELEGLEEERGREEEEAAEEVASAPAPPISSLSPSRRESASMVRAGSGGCTVEEAADERKKMRRGRHFFSRSPSLRAPHFPPRPPLTLPSRRRAAAERDRSSCSRG